MGFQRARYSTHSGSRRYGGALAAICAATWLVVGCADTGSAASSDEVGAVEVDAADSLDSDIAATANDGGDADDSDRGDTQEVSSDPWPPRSETCAVDCETKLDCKNGKVNFTPGGYFDPPCALNWQCPGPEPPYPCTAGCGLSTRCNDPWVGFYDKSLLCAESQPARLGARCEVDADCQWPCSPLSWGASPGDGSAVYRACDTTAASSVCVDIDPPTGPPDFGLGCGATWASLGIESSNSAMRAYADQSGCSTGLCIAEAAASCLFQACSIPCEGDYDCPPGWLCGLSLSSGGGACSTKLKKLPGIICISM